MVHFFAALVRYITLAFAAIAALGRLGIETSSIIAVIGAAGLAVLGDGGASIILDIGSLLLAVDEAAMSVGL